MSASVLSLLAGFGLARAWDVVVVLSGLGRNRRRALPAAAIRLIDRDMPGLLSARERSSLRRWLATVSWSELADTSSPATSDHIVATLADAFLDGSADSSSSGDAETGARQRAAAALGIAWQALLESLESDELLVMDSELRRRADTRTVETFLRQIVNDMAMFGVAIETLAAVEQVVESVERAYGVQPQLVPGRALLRNPTAVGPGQLLSPRYGLVPFRFRDSELDLLQAWAENGPAVRVAVVIGQAGAGKSRLAVELCERLTDQEGWMAGLLSGDIGQPGAFAAGTGGPLAVVVDYAEARVAEVQSMLGAVLRRRANLPVRIVLLMRNPESPQDPLNRMRFVVDEVDEVLDDAAVVRLAPHDWSAAERLAFLDLARKSFAVALHRDLPLGRHADLEGFPTPLELSIEALLEFSDWDHGDEQRYEEDALTRLLRHEERYWLAVARAQGLTHAPPVLAGCIMTCAIVGDAVRSHDDLVQALRLVPDLADATSEEFHDLARWLRRTYPGDAGDYVARLTPDALADRLLAGT
jgi:GTPase SAR1 family protein